MATVSRNVPPPPARRGRRGMSHVPRVASDGRVLLPSKLTRERFYYRAELSSKTRDPFGWTADRLLLAESFARLNVLDRSACERWFRAHGMVDSHWLKAGNVDSGRFGPVPDPYGGVIDDEIDIAFEQVTVDWHLTLLTLLSETRASKEWKPEWAQVVFDGAGQGLIIGGPYAGRRVTSALSWETDKEKLAADLEQRAVYHEQVVLHEATEGWRRVLVLDSLWRDLRPPTPDGRNFSIVREAEKRASVLGTTWDETVELLRLTIEPRVQRAVERRFTTEVVAKDMDRTRRRVLIPVEVREWRSILHPIYLQLFEALLRISEGKPGATVCRECGRPFLILDARRQLFCNNRERYRHAQRERRRRLRSEERVE